MILFFFNFTYFYPKFDFQLSTTGGSNTVGNHVKQIVLKLWYEPNYQNSKGDNLGMMNKFSPTFMHARLIRFICLRLCKVGTTARVDKNQIAALTHLSTNCTIAISHHHPYYTLRLYFILR